MHLLNPVGLFGWLLSVLGFVVSLALYFLPTIVASARRSTRTGTVFVIDLLLGWSFLGWIVAMVVAVASNRRPPVL